MKTILLFVTLTPALFAQWGKAEWGISKAQLQAVYPAARDGFRRVQVAGPKPSLWQQAKMQAKCDMVARYGSAKAAAQIKALDIDCSTASVRAYALVPAFLVPDVEIGTLRMNAFPVFGRTGELVAVTLEAAPDEDSGKCAALPRLLEDRYGRTDTGEWLTPTGRVNVSGCLVLYTVRNAGSGL